MNRSGHQRDRGPEAPERPRAAERFFALLSHPRLPLAAALLGTLLVSPSLFIGFHLDDYVHRYLLSDLPGARELMTAYESPFGIANGEPAINRWQIEQGYAPWWTPDDLLISLFRPISEASHRLDAALWPDNAFAMHAHNLLWYFALCFVAARLFRSLLGAGSAAAGLCAILYAFDYTHGFAVGWIANRNAIIAACFGVAALWAHHEGRSRPSRAAFALSPVLFACALLAGEGSLAIFGYLLGHALFLDRGRPSARVLAIAPHVLLIVAWRVLYNAIGRGADGSGLYLDPVREPLRFAVASLSRVPLLVMGELATPPAQSSLFVGPPWDAILLAAAVLISAWFIVAVAPLVCADPVARFFAFGMAASLPPACTTHPHSRLLFFVGLGAMGLLCQLWLGVLSRAPWSERPRPLRGPSHAFAALFMGFHLLISPLMLSGLSCSIALTTRIQRGVESLVGEAAGRDLIVVSAPEYFYVKLIPVQNALRGLPGPRRLRALSFGAVPLRLTRKDLRTLELQFEGGLLREPLLQLYRAADNPLTVGERIELEGLTIEVTEVTGDKHVLAARFAFDRPLEDPSFRFVHWNGRRFEGYRPPPVGGSSRLAPAEIRFGF